MMRRSGLVAVAAMILLAGATARAQERDVGFVVVAMPAALLIDMEGSKFAVEGGDGSRVTLSEVYTMPNLALGAGLTVGNAKVDVLGGAGVLINDGFRSFVLQAIADVTWEVANSLEIGPRAGLVYLPNPEWLENDDLDFDSDLGFLLGVQIAMGDKIQYMLSVDLIDFSLDVKDPRAGVSTSEDALEMSALAIQFGVRGEF